MISVQYRYENGLARNLNYFFRQFVKTETACSNVTSQVYWSTLILLYPQACLPRSWLQGPCKCIGG